MSERAIFEADYYNFEYKKGLKVCRLIFEVPYERAKLVRDALGDPPLPGAQVRVAIARIHEGAGAPVPEKAEPVAKSEKAEGDRSSSRTQAAGRMVKERAFQEWLEFRYPDSWDAACGSALAMDALDVADLTLKKVLGITSKKELDANPDKAEAWERMLTTFKHRHTVRA